MVVGEIVSSQYWASPRVLKADANCEFKNSVGSPVPALTTPAALLKTVLDAEAAADAASAAASAAADAASAALLITVLDIIILSKSSLYLREVENNGSSDDRVRPSTQNIFMFSCVILKVIKGISSLLIFSTITLPFRPSIY
jgi:hypothetical protein